MPDHSTAAALTVIQKGTKIYSHVRGKWLDAEPEEIVRQQFLCTLVNDFGFSIDQIDEELEVTGRGAGHARADFVIWRSHNDKINSRPPLIIVECKSDNVTINETDYHQGDNYARLTDAPFFVTHNSKETRFWRVRKDKLPGYIEEIESIPDANASEDEIRKAVEKLKLFKENEFADLLHSCHNVIRNREHKDPAAAFDEIAKIMFVKVYVERRMQQQKLHENVFTVDVLEKQISEDPINSLFDSTKEVYKNDGIFSEGEKINLKPSTSSEIVRKLEKYNLSETQEDIKGIAFERFLGRTFRGEIGQFFTPRTIVEFMVEMINPAADETVCDPAAGSGGFLIRCFEMMWEQVSREIDTEYQEYRKSLEAQQINDEERTENLQKLYDKLQSELDPSTKGTRAYRLTHEQIFGVDANERMAKTCKMNMIMHGDGHHGVYHQNGFLNVDGIFENRFDVVLTNPPFGSNVETTDLVTPYYVQVSRQNYEACKAAYGEAYVEAQKRVASAENKPILSLFDIPKTAKSQTKTEILFIERCLELLKPGGRLGIVLPEGILNNPSMEYVRDFVEQRAVLVAIVSLPPETFKSSEADVKASLVFIQKFTVAESEQFERRKQEIEEEVERTLTLRLNTIKGIVERLNSKESGREAKKRRRSYVKRAEKLAQKRKSAMCRQKLRATFRNPVFLYDAEFVGISSTGKSDFNELYPNPNVPDKVGKTAVECYREFLDWLSSREESASSSEDF